MEWDALESYVIDLTTRCIRKEDIKGVRRPEFLFDDQGWEEACSCAEKHGILSLFLKTAMGANWWAEIPGRVQKRLQHRFEQQELVRSRYFEETEIILENITEENSALILLTDTEMIRCFYGKTDLLRDTTHLEIIVHEDSLRSILKQLGKGGYRSAVESINRKSAVVTRGKDEPLVYVSTAFFEGDTVEKMEVLWERTKAADFPKWPKRIRTLLTEEACVYLVRKISSGSGPALISRYMDLKHLLEKEKSINWVEVKNSLRNWGAEPEAWFVLSTLSSVFGCEPAGDAKSQFEKSVPQIRKDFYKKLSANGKLLASTPEETLTDDLKRQYAVHGTWSTALQESVKKLFKKSNQEAA